MSEKMREEFESWATSCHMCTYLDGVEYRHQSTEWAWLAWQASRAALVVELPTLENGLIHPFDGSSMIVDAVARQLDCAGVKYK